LFQFLFQISHYFAGVLTEMNNLKKDKTIYPRVCRGSMYQIQSIKKSPRSLQIQNIYPLVCQSSMNQIESNKKRQDKPQIHTCSDKKISIQNAYTSLCNTYEEFKIPVVKKTFGKGIVRISCKTCVQLDNIALIVKGLVKLHLIEESEMEPLEYSFKMNSLVLFLKPADVASKQKLEHAFKKFPFEYNYLVFDVEEYDPSVTEKELSFTESSQELSNPVVGIQMDDDVYGMGLMVITTVFFSILILIYELSRF